MRIGEGELTYEVVLGWGRSASGMDLGQAPGVTKVNIKGVAVDSQDRVYLINRGDSRQVLIFDKDGEFITSVGEGVLADPHGICVGPDNRVYVVDRETHVVVCLSAEGRVQLTLGNMNRPSPKQSGTPFNLPTGVALSSEGDIYIADGYGNSTIHKYSSTGSLNFSWGGQGIHPGQFNLPHGICVDAEDRVYVADRENNRVQVFDEEGDFIKQWQDLTGPSDVAVDKDGNLYVSELEGRRVSVLSYGGDVLARWDGGSEGTNQFLAPHGICVDSLGSVYLCGVGEGKRVLKFVRKS